MMMADRLFFVAMIVIPSLLMVVSGYALQYEKLDTISVAAVDEDGSESSRLLITRLMEKEGIKLYPVPRKEGLSMLDENQVEQVFILHAGFGERLERGESEGLIELISAPSSYSAGFVRELVAGEAIRLMMSNSAVNRVEEQYKEMGIQKGSGFRYEVFSFLDALWEPEPLMTIEYRELRAGILTDDTRSTLPSASASSAGLITAFVMFYMLFGSGWLIEERTNGTIKRLGAGKGAIAVSFGGSVLALFAAGCVQILIFCTVQRLLFGIALFTGLLSYMVLLAYLLSVIGISMFLSALLKTPTQLQAGAPVLALLTGFAGGCFWNFIEPLAGLKQIALLTPQGWALSGINSLLKNPAAYSGALGPVAVLLTIALILLPLSYIIIHMQLEQG